LTEEGEFIFAEERRMNAEDRQQTAGRNQKISSAQLNFSWPGYNNGNLDLNPNPHLFPPPQHSGTLLIS
jgi:hypothetical protein